MSRPTASILLVASVLLAAALRLPALAARPMHADEAVHADKLGTLLEGGGYVYDPSEYHGPTLYYLTLPLARALGERRYVEIDEATLRAVPALLGILLVAAHAGARAALGPGAAAFAALLCALSPAMVYFSRYYIHEVPLVLFTFGALLGLDGWRRGPGMGSALATGASVGLMLATKETAPLALAAIVLAAAAVALAAGGARTRPPDGFGRHAAAAALAALAVAGLLFSSFLANPKGLADAVRSYGFYLDRAGGASVHFHPWHYYLGLVTLFPTRGTPAWTEALVLVLALVGAVAAWRPGPPGVDPTAPRFLSVYSLALLALYSAIPYKTPWCALGFLHGMILLAGTGAAFVLGRLRGAARAAATMALAVAATHLGWQAYSGTFRHAADPRNPWVYAHTTPDVYPIVERLRAVARAHPDGRAMPLDVVSRENLWPLPFYLRDFTGVRWWNGVSDDATPAPLVLLTPDMEPALVRRLYEVPPPGERELHVPVFDGPVFLRPAVELRGYAARSLWEAYRQLEPEPAADGAAPGGMP